MRFLLSLLLFLLTAAAAQQPPQPASASLQTADAIAALRADNNSRQATLRTLQEMLSQAQPQETAAVSQDDLSEVRVALDQIRQSIETVENKITATQNQLTAQQNQCDSLNAQLQRLANPLSANGPAAEGESQDAVQRQFDGCQKQVLDLGTLLTLQKSSLQLMQRQQTLRERQYKSLNESYLQNSGSREPAQDSAYAPTLQSLQTEREQLTASLHQEGDSRTERLNKNIELALVGKQILLTTLSQDFQAIDRRLQELQFADFASVSLERIIAVKEELSDFTGRLAVMQSQLSSNMDFIKQQYSLYQRQQDSVPAGIDARHEALLTSYRSFSSMLSNAQETLNLVQQTVDSQFAAQSKNYLTQRYQFGGWKNLPHLAEQIGGAFTAFVGQYAVSFKSLQQSSSQLTGTRTAWLAGIAAVIIALTAFITSHMNKLVRRRAQNTRMAFSGRLLVFVFGMLKYNLPYIGLLALTYAVLSITRLPSPSYDFILLVPIAILLVCIPHFSIKILMQSQLLANREHRRLAAPVTIAAAIGGVLLSCVFLSSWILTDSAVIDTFSWIYALYILIITYPLWRLMRQMRRVLDSQYSDFYTYRILRIVMRLVPLGFLFFGIAGTLGYLNLAWLTARYLLIALIYTLIWIGFLGLCKDLSIAAKTLAVRRTSNGVFWAQDVINPLHAIARYGSFILLCTLLFKTYGWTANTPIIAEILAMLRRPLFGGAAGQFTIMNLLLMGVLIYAVFRLGIWMKSLCYRWVYAKISDLGVRNSLAVFSQYAIVTLGFLLALRVIGIDLTAFTVFAGALGVGIGFGLQTIANNFISGILLLIERPLRNGDVITVGKYEGTVERIGMRSLTMTTFNNESVILPNSDFVTSAFQNWSHTDQIVRVSLYLDLSYKHDPQDVEETLETALLALAEAGQIINITDFEPGVFSWNCSDRGITYRIIYYVHLENHHYLGARHAVIRTLWQTCFEHGFEIAYPKTDLFLPDRAEEFQQYISERRPPKTRNNHYPNL